MNNSFRRLESEMRQLSSVFANLHTFDGILRRLTGFFQLTEEELSDAGIYIGNRR